jgi:hypothetical protein
VAAFGFFERPWTLSLNSCTASGIVILRRATISRSEWHLAHVAAMFWWLTVDSESVCARTACAGPWQPTQVEASRSPRARARPWMLSLYCSLSLAWQLAQNSGVARGFAAIECAAPWQRVQFSSAFSFEPPCTPAAIVVTSFAWHEPQRTGARCVACGTRAASRWQSMHASLACAEPLTPAAATSSDLPECPVPSEWLAWQVMQLWSEPAEALASRACASTPAPAMAASSTTPARPRPIARLTLATPSRLLIVEASSDSPGSARGAGTASAYRTAVCSDCHASSGPAARAIEHAAAATG